MQQWSIVASCPNWIPLFWQIPLLTELSHKLLKCHVEHWHCCPWRGNLVLPQLQLMAWDAKLLIFCCPANTTVTRKRTDKRTNASWEGTEFSVMRQCQCIGVWVCGKNNFTRNRMTEVEWSCIRHRVANAKEERRHLFGALAFNLPCVCKWAMCFVRSGYIEVLVWTWSSLPVQCTVWKSDIYVRIWEYMAIWQSLAIR